MSRHIEPPKTIAERGGLFSYQDQTKSLHNGLGAEDWKLRRQLGVPPSRICKDFNISIRTYYNWLKIEPPIDPQPESLQSETRPSPEQGTL